MLATHMYGNQISIFIGWQETAKMCIAAVLCVCVAFLHSIHFWGLFGFRSS